MIHHKVLTLIAIGLFSVNSDNNAADKFNSYRGGIHIKLVEPSGHSYGTTADKSTNDQFYLGLEQISGQALSLSTNKILFDQSKNTKYHAIVNIEKQENDSFTAKINVFENSLKSYPNAKSKITSQLITSHHVGGIFNQKNEYRLIEDGLPNVYLTIFIDKLFSKVEIQQRLLTIQKSNIKQAD